VSLFSSFFSLLCLPLRVLILLGYVAVHSSVQLCAAGYSSGLRRDDDSHIPETELNRVHSYQHYTTISFVMPACLSVCLLGTTRLQSDVFSFNLISEDVSKIC
jgi:hypothetical protein